MLRAGDGEATGLKWLADKDCLIVATGEGYCRYIPAILKPHFCRTVHQEDRPHAMEKKKADAATTWWMPREDSGGGGGGMRFGGGKGLSLTAIVLIVGIGWLTGQDPMQILGQLTGQMEQAPSVSTQSRQAPPANDEHADFVRAVLGDTEDTWAQVFQETA